MKVSLRHHYGWQTYNVKARSLHEAAYKAVRKSHEFLTDDNHTCEKYKGLQRLQWGGKEVKWRSIIINRNKNSPIYSGPSGLKTDYWFTVEYRKPGAR